MNNNVVQISIKRTRPSAFSKFPKKKSYSPTSNAAFSTKN
uniref:Uncharacterized protein n=1 Tax=Rhizophora mucronata TaxID=61149 RepID=A0A2P2P4T6_RHIMU